MLSSTEFVELIDNVVQFVSKRVEDNRKLSLLLLHVHEEAVEGWDQVIFAAIVQCIVHLTLGLDPSLLSNLRWVLVFLVLVGGLFLFIVILSWHAAIFADTEFFTGTLGEG